MQQALPTAHCELRRRCPGLCSTSYATPHCLPRRAARPWRVVAMASNSSNLFDYMDRQFEFMERQMDREIESMRVQVDRDVNAALSRAQAAEQQALRQQSQLFEGTRAGPNVDIQRQEESGPGMYRYYERIQITSGGGSGRTTYIGQPPPAAAASVVAPAPSLNPAFVGALVLAGGYLTLTAAFNKNYPLTNYAESKRWLLLALWPLLFLFSPKFREQFNAAVRGERAGIGREGPAGGAGGSGSGSL
ncbi:hypothetical protein PLESTM_000964900 [Pleodorina starrii]|nr:hypothetical protein PLESTM_000964900 [Pleodorina starrii]